MFYVFKGLGVQGLQARDQYGRAWRRTCNPMFLSRESGHGKATREATAAGPKPGKPSGLFGVSAQRQHTGQVLNNVCK